MSGVASDRIDTVGMFELTAGLPEQVEAAAALAADVDGLPEHDDVENVLVLGMGGSGIAGDVLTAIAGPFMPVPAIVSKVYECPSFVGEGTLCFAISYSGNTEEVVEAATEAAASGAQMVVLSSGGQLADLARQWGATWIPLPEDIPMPRAGIGAVSIPPLVVLERIGLFPGASGWIAEAVAQLKRRRAQLVQESNPALDLARALDRSIPLLYGADLGAVAALRWKNQINENAKAPAFWAANPELCHNEIAGWGQHGDVTRQVLNLVNLRHDDEHPQIGRRFEIVTELMQEVVADVHEVRAEGEGDLAQLFDLMYFGDWVSLHLAWLASVDPGPITVLDDLKRRLAE